jgi:hypothetical protein
MRDSRSRLVNLIACQNGCDKAKLLNFKLEWLRDCNDRVFGKLRAGTAFPGQHAAPEGTDLQTGRPDGDD